ncbi:MAG: HD domain-containing protein [Oscillospiraceae bacterium]|nr:HD domain-containing protein [Oscillospiraceae bacterium]
MNIDIPRNVCQIIKKLESSGFEAYIVGGCVRDAFLGKTPKDYDITTSASPEEIKKCFDDCAVIETGIKHGTVTVVSEGENIEVTTFRIDGEYIDGRHPEKVQFSKNLLDDLSRRDFTINAMAYNPRVGLIDNFGGQSDLFNRRIVCVGDPSVRFREDALRILRAMRFASELDFEIEENTAEAIHNMKGNLANISEERISEELTKLLMGESPCNVLINYSDVISRIIPEIKPCIGFDQHNRYHIYDIWKHSAVSVEHSKHQEEVRLALMLHDIGKPGCFKLDDEGNGHFFGHEKIGAEMAEKILRRLRFPNDVVERTAKLIKYHYVTPVNDYKVVRRLLATVGEEDFFLLAEVMKGDNRAKHSSCFERVHVLEAMSDKAQEIIDKKLCIKIADLAVSGSDMIELGFSGAEIGEVLKSLLDAVLDEKIGNTYDELMDYAENCHNTNP